MWRIATDIIDEKLKFRGVEEYCIECHNRDYGKAIQRLDEND